MPLPTASRRPAEAPIQGIAVGSLQTTERVRLDPAPPFLFSVSPDAYECVDVDGEPLYLPIISKHPISAGINGVDKGGGIAHLSANLITRGDIAIQPSQCPAEFTPDGQPGYMRRYEGVQGAVHLEAWIKVVKAPGNANATQLTPAAEQSFRKWRLWLMESGLVPFPTEDWIQRHEDRIGERAHRRAQIAAAPEVKAQRAEAAQAEVQRARKARVKTEEVANG
jgi:hypothetical protein